LVILWANFFGRRSMGSIYSLVNPFYYTTNAIGPIFGGFFFDLWGSYRFPFLTFAAILILSGAISVRLRAPVHPDGLSSVTKKNTKGIQKRGPGVTPFS
jgi:MFS family permease